MLVVCCVCNLVKTNNGWLPGQFRAEERPSHGYCPTCHQRMLYTIIAHANRAALASVAI